MELYREKYIGYGPTLAAECLARDDGLGVPVSTLRAWLSGAGLWQQQRQGKLHRRRRARREHYGELLQMDGSHHTWFQTHHHPFHVHQQLHPRHPPSRVPPNNSW